MLPYTNRSRPGENKESLELARSCTYDLLSVVVHVGEIDTGECGPSRQRQHAEFLTIFK